MQEQTYSVRVIDHGRAENDPARSYSIDDIPLSDALARAAHAYPYANDFDETRWVVPSDASPEIALALKTIAVWMDVIDNSQALDALEEVRDALLGTVS
jgi:hypothetical protein